jgi:hypothetical protein
MIVIGGMRKYGKKDAFTAGFRVRADEDVDPYTIVRCG